MLLLLGKNRASETMTQCFSDIILKSFRTWNQLVEVHVILEVIWKHANPPNCWLSRLLISTFYNVHYFIPQIGDTIHGFSILLRKILYLQYWDFHHYQQIHRSIFSMMYCYFCIAESTSATADELLFFFSHCLTKDLGLGDCSALGWHWGYFCSVNMCHCYVNVNGWFWWSSKLDYIVVTTPQLCWIYTSRRDGGRIWGYQKSVRNLSTKYVV